MARGGDISVVDGGGGERWRHAAAASVGVRRQHRRRGGSGGSVGGSAAARGAGQRRDRRQRAGTAGRGGTRRRHGGTRRHGRRHGGPRRHGRRHARGAAAPAAARRAAAAPAAATTCASRPEICNNGVDDNCNNLADCQDPGCFGDPRCAPPGQEICNNNLDDDDDGRIDCADPDCMNSLVLQADDGHGDLRQRRRRQQQQPGRLRRSAVHDVPGLPRGVVHGRRRLRHHRGPRRQRVARSMDTTDAAAGYATCAPVRRRAVGSAGSSSTRRRTSALDFKQGVGQRARRRPVPRRRQPALRSQPRRLRERRWTIRRRRSTFPALPAGVYWSSSSPIRACRGATTVTLSTGSVATPEICANGRDDDGNGLIDCQDAACKNHASCVGSQCVPDLNVGTLVVDGPARTATANLAHRDRRLPVHLLGGHRRAATSRSRSRWPRRRGWRSSSSRPGRSIFALFRMPGPGPRLRRRSAVVRVRGRRRRTRSRSSTCRRDATCSSSRRRHGPGRARSTCGCRRSAAARVEICGNGIDDDTNGLTDCDDPGCFGVGGCPAPACMPDPGPRARSRGERGRRSSSIRA